MPQKRLPLFLSVYRTFMEERGFGGSMQPRFLAKARKSCAVMMAFAVLVATPVLPTRPAMAYDNDAALEQDGYLCTRQAFRSERKYGIPHRLLSAISVQESGRRHKGLGIQVPWPWTINAEGTPYLFRTKADAVAKVKELQAAGMKSIDVGCMQVNLRHHPNAFANLNQAFEPAFNVDYAARYLRSHYDETNSWKTAVGHYHSRTPAFGQRYIASVYAKWYGIANSVNRDRSRQFASINGQTINDKGTVDKPAQRAGKTYKSYIRDESSGEQVTLAKATPMPSSSTPSLRIVKPGATRQNSKGQFDLSLIRPASAAGKVESAPVVNVAEDTSIVMSLRPEGRSAAAAKAVTAEPISLTESKDPRIIRFVE